MKENIMPVKAFYFDDENFYIFYPIKQSLFSFIHEASDGRKLEYEDKIQII
jgi:hypothetical protein